MKFALVLLLLSALAAAPALTPHHFKHTDYTSGWAEVWRSCFSVGVRVTDDLDALESTLWLPTPWRVGALTAVAVRQSEAGRGVSGRAGLAAHVASWLYVGATAGAGRLPDNIRESTFEAGFVLKPTGWLHVTGAAAWRDEFDDGFSLPFSTSPAWRSGLWLRPRPDWMLGCEYNSASRYAVELRHRWGLSLRVEGADTADWSIGASWRIDTGSLGFTAGADVSREGHTAVLLGADVSFGRYRPPVRLPVQAFTVIRNQRRRHGLVVVPALGAFEPSEVRIVVKRGDNLTHIARNLPPGALPEYRGNVRAIADYNGIDDPSLIQVGQVIRVPSRKLVEAISAPPDSTRLLVERLLDATHATDIAETAVNRAVWRHKLNGAVAMESALPVHGGAANSWLLNARALADIHRLRYETAVRQLRWAVELAPGQPVLHANLGAALFWSDQPEEAALHLRRAIDLGYTSETVIDLLRRIEELR
ncbi:MAG: LysM peptidoglycan-binding domain-containing protein [Candidatus Cloacimonetes bacterium]|nr:LysM peptidoglycan-binding domain-containing protein [Candidatus Cloacimonadota bacterium]